MDYLVTELKQAGRRFTFACKHKSIDKIGSLEEPISNEKLFSISEIDALYFTVRHSCILRFRE